MTDTEKGCSDRLAEKTQNCRKIEGICKLDWNITRAPVTRSMFLRCIKEQMV